jgi:hypothetical protein
MHADAGEVAAVTAALDEGNTPPVISPIDAKTVEAGLELQFFVEATDADVPAQLLTFSLAGAPAGMVIDSLSGLVTWTPPANSPGDVLSILVRVTDSAGGSAEEAFHVIVVPQPMTQGVQLINGNLIIDGTPGDDVVNLVGTAEAGAFRINGTLWAGLVTGVTGDIRIDLGEGNDRLEMNQVYTAGDIKLNLGGGQDLVGLGNPVPVSTARDFTLDLGAGDDQLSGAEIFVRGDQSFAGGPGNDVIALLGNAAPGLFRLGASSGGETLVNGGDGDDRIEVSYSFIAGGWTIDAGAGNDFVSVRTSAAAAATGVFGAGGNDHLATDACYFASHLSMDGGAGSDWIDYRNSIGLIQTGILGADGHDLIDVANVGVNSLRIDGGAGNDTVSVRASLLAQLFADLGEHDDALTVESNLVYGSAELHGGLGMSDWLTDRGNLFRGAIRKRTFEMFAG